MAGGVAESDSNVRLASDRSDSPLALLAEGKPARPDAPVIASDPWAFTRQYQTAPMFHHAINLRGDEVGRRPIEEVVSHHAHELPGSREAREGGMEVVHQFIAAGFIAFFSLNSPSAMRWRCSRTITTLLSP
jgi:hypothetical protein